MSEIRERFDFQAALERARKVLSNPNAVVECVRGVSIDWQEAANVAKPVRKLSPRVHGENRRTPLSGLGHVTHGDSQWRVLTHSCTSIAW